MARRYQRACRREILATVLAERQRMFRLVINSEDSEMQRLAFEPRTGTEPVTCGPASSHCSYRTVTTWTEVR